MAIKNIIFDLGGVILKLDLQLTVTAFHQLGAKNLSMDFLKTPLLHYYEKGMISSSDFRKELCALTKIAVTNEEFDKAWNAALLDIPPEKLALIAELKKKHRTFLLSNTNEIHWQRVMQIFQKENQLTSLTNYFEKEYYSHLLGMRKPSKEIFLKILTENNLIAAETLFIDDYYENIAGANQVGLQTLHLDHTKSLLTAVDFIRT